MPAVNQVEAHIGWHVRSTAAADDDDADGDHDHDYDHADVFGDDADDDDNDDNDDPARPALAPVLDPAPARAPSPLT